MYLCWSKETIMIEVYYAEDDEIIGKSVKRYLEQQNCGKRTRYSKKSIK